MPKFTALMLAVAMLIVGTAEVAAQTDRRIPGGRGIYFEKLQPCTNGAMPYSSYKDSVRYDTCPDESNVAGEDKRQQFSFENGVVRIVCGQSAIIVDARTTPEVHYLCLSEEVDITKMSKKDARRQYGVGTLVLLGDALHLPTVGCSEIAPKLSKCALGEATEVTFTYRDPGLVRIQPAKKKQKR